MKPLYMQFSALNSEDAFGYVNVSIRLDGSIFGIRYSQVVIGHHAKWNSMRRRQFPRIRTLDPKYRRTESARP